MAAFTDQLNELDIFIEDMRSTSKSTEKIKILKQQSYFIQKVLEYTYNPYKQYHLTSKTLIKKKDIVEKTGYFDLFYLLDALRHRSITGHEAIAYVNSFISSLDLRQKDLIYKIIDKYLGI